MAGEIFLAENLHPPTDTECGSKDIFPFEGDKVVEHWDVIQEIPDASVNSNGMF